MVVDLWYFYVLFYWPNYQPCHFFHIRFTHCFIVFYFCCVYAEWVSDGSINNACKSMYMVFISYNMTNECMGEAICVWVVGGLWVGDIRSNGVKHARNYSKRKQPQHEGKRYNISNMYLNRGTPDICGYRPSSSTYRGEHRHLWFGKLLVRN